MASHWKLGTGLRYAFVGNPRRSRYATVPTRMSDLALNRALISLIASSLTHSVKVRTQIAILPSGSTSTLDKLRLNCSAKPPRQRLWQGPATSAPGAIQSLACVGSVAPTVAGSPAAVRCRARASMGKTVVSTPPRLHCFWNDTVCPYIFALR